MRNAFISELVSLASEYEHIALLVGDLGYSVVEPFAERFPERFINAGVAEQNMAGLAAGLASEGYHVFTYSISNFPTFRCAEQIRNDIDYHKLPVTTVAVGGGLGYGTLGYSHHAIQDFALMRSMPNMLLAIPSDPMEVRACLRYLIKHPQPSYLRLGKAGEPSLHKSIPEVAPGRWLKIDESTQKQTNQLIILTTGAIAGQAKSWVNQIELEDYQLYSLPLWGMQHKLDQVNYVGNCKKLVTVEEHLIDGGFGSWISEALEINRNPHLVKRSLGIQPSVCGMVGDQEYLKQANGLTKDHLLRTCRP
jgi:transketolase